MNHVRKFAIIGTTAAALLVAPAAAAAAQDTAAAPSPVVSNYSPSCGGITWHSPRDAGHTLSASDLGLSSPSSVLERAASQHVQWIATTTCKTKERLPLRVAAPASSGPGIAAITSPSLNWSGYEAEVTAPAAAAAYWTVPYVSSDGQVSAFSSIWPGIGGDPAVSGGAGELIQAGTEEDATASEEPNTYFWIEWFPTVAQIPQSLNIDNGDSVAASVSWSNTDGQATFVLCNYTKNQCASGSIATPAPGNSAEVIVERTQINGGLPELANFGSVTFTGAVYFKYASDGGESYQTFSNGGQKSTMVDWDGTTVLAQPGSLSDGGTQFTDTWYAFGLSGHF